MKTKSIIIIVCCINLAAFTLGATGVIKVKHEAVQESQDSDRLIGVLITKEYLDLFDSDRYFNDNINKILNGREISEFESAKYQGRLYATLVETSLQNENGDTIATKEYDFDDVDGIRFFAPFINEESGSYWSTNIDEGIADCNTHFLSKDDGESVSLKGTIYIASHNSLGNFYFNPVYQSSNGEVYAVSGSGVFLGDGNVPGVSWSQKITENREIASGEANTSSGTDVEVTVCVIDKPINIALLQFDNKNELLAIKEYLPGTMPEHIDALSDTQYIIIESVSDQDVSRTLFQKTDETLFSFYCREDGLCIKQSSEIAWKN